MSVFVKFKWRYIVEEKIRKLFGKSFESMNVLMNGEGWERVRFRIGRGI